jgi:hypothetical protein
MAIATGAQRDVIERAFGIGRDPRLWEEITAELGLSEKSVESRLIRGVAKIRKSPEKAS